MQKNNRIKLEHLPEQYRRQVEEKLASTDALPLGISGTGNEVTEWHLNPGETIKALTKKHRAVRAMNKTEERFMREVLGTLKLTVDSIHPQALVLDFGDGTSYRPDFVTVDRQGVITVWEVKGGHVGKCAWSRHGIERFRRARQHWPHIRFILATWDKKKWNLDYGDTCKNENDM